MFNKKIKFLICILNIFCLINIFLGTSVLGFSAEDIPTPIKTIVKVLVVSAQVIASGYFTIQLTVRGIQYFTAVAAAEKAENKHAITWTLIQGVVTIAGITILGKALNLIE